MDYWNDMDFLIKLSSMAKNPIPPRGSLLGVFDLKSGFLLILMI